MLLPSSLSLSIYSIYIFKCINVHVYCLLSWFACLDELISVSTDTCAHNRVCGLNRWPSPSQPGRTEPCPLGYDHQTYSATSADLHRHSNPWPDTAEQKRRDTHKPEWKDEQTELYKWQTEDHDSWTLEQNWIMCQGITLNESFFVCAPPCWKKQ